MKKFLGPLAVTIAAILLPAIILGSVKAANMPKISVSPVSVNLGSVKAGSTSNLRTANIKNTGNADLIINSITITGANQSEYNQTNSCSTIPAKNSCPITVTFSPTVPFGKKSATMSISSNDPKNPTIKVQLLGQAPPPKITISPTSVNFGSVAVGNTSAPKVITIKNTGISDLTVNAITLTGTNAAEFGKTSVCSTVAKGSSCAISVTLSPASAGSKSALMTISSNDPKKPIITVKLSGKGTGTPPPPCTYTYSDWLSCQPNGTQTRTVVSSSPAGCSGTPVLSQSCTPPQLTLSAISVTSANQGISIGTTQQFTASGTYSDGSTRDITAQVTWNSSNTSFATIDTYGFATGVAPGTTNITAAIGNILGSTTLTVLPNPTIVIAENTVITDPLLAVLISSDTNEAVAIIGQRDATGNIIKLSSFIYVTPNGRALELDLGSDGMPVSLTDDTGNKAVFSNYTTNTVDITFYQKDTLVSGPTTVSISEDTLSEYEQLLPTLGITFGQAMKHSNRFDRALSTTSCRVIKYSIILAAKLTGLGFSVSSCATLLVSEVLSPLAVIPCSSIPLGAVSAWNAVTGKEDVALLSAVHTGFGFSECQLSIVTGEWMDCVPAISDAAARALENKCKDPVPQGIPILTPPPPACIYTCADDDWTLCGPDNEQTCKNISSNPTGCVGTTPVKPLNRPCKYNPPCISFICSSWGNCETDGTQTCPNQNIVGSPSGCVLSQPPTQKCTPPCTGYMCSGWGNCQPDGTQTCPDQNIVGSPSGCVLSQPPTRECECTSYTCSAWGNCQPNGTRTCPDQNIVASPPGCVGTPPEQIPPQSCTLPLGFPTNVPVGTYDIACSDTSPQTVSGADIYQLAAALISGAGQASAAFTAACSGTGCSCSSTFSSFSPFDGSSFTATFTPTVTCVLPDGSVVSTSETATCTITKQ